MRKGFQVAALASALSLVMGGAALAATKADLQFGGWDVSGPDATINVGAGTVCEVDFTCSTVAQGAGFIQLQLNSNATEPSEAGVSYIMTIVTDQDASGNAGELPFEDVSFVQMRISTSGTPAPNVNGIFSQQKITEEVGNTVFTSESAITSGWAATEASNPVAISQTLVDKGPTTSIGDDFDTTFYYVSSNDAAGVRDGFAMSIDQSAGLESATSLSPTDVQVFAFRERQGKLLAAPGSVPLNGETLDWVATDDVKATWIGQKIALGTGTGSLGGDFGFLSFQNVTTPKTISEFGFTTANSTSASAWHEAFVVAPPVAPDFLPGGAPCITDPSGADCL